MKRHNRAALAVAALALVIPVSGCASLLSPHQTAEYHYNGGDGASGSVGDVEVRGLMLITDEKGSGPAQLFFTLINKGDSTAKVSVEVADTTVSESIKAGDTSSRTRRAPETFLRRSRHRRQPQGRPATSSTSPPRAQRREGHRDPAPHQCSAVLRRVRAVGFFVGLAVRVPGEHAQRGCRFRRRNRCSQRLISPSSDTGPGPRESTEGATHMT